MKRLKNIPSVIEKLDFNLPGKIVVKLEDGRVLITPLKYFPELSKLPVAKRKQYTIVDDRTILFKNAEAIYHLEDFIGLEENWKAR